MIRAIARKCGVHLPFTGVVCAEQVRTIYIETDWRARVTVKRTLVFLERPAEGDLYDTYAPPPGQRIERLVYNSPDATETGRLERRDGSVVVYWQPRHEITRYAPYTHQDTWVPPTVFQQSAILTEYRPEPRTGVAITEIVTPLIFEKAVVFERPRWPMLTNEYAIVKYALEQLDNGGHRPSIAPDGKKVEWTIMGPRPGSRYVCVAFHQHGVAEWQERLRSGTVLGRLSNLLGRAKRRAADLTAR
jgi:hypothetical protein